MTVSKALLGALFIVAGVMHFVATPVYMRIVPPPFGDARLLVLVSGAFEILGGIGVLVPMTQRFSAWGLIALLVAVLPANVYMAMHQEQWPAIPVWALWARVPLQLPMVVWAWAYAKA